MFLSLSGQIESQLREAYGRRYAAGAATQSAIAKKLGVDRSAVHHRLMGHTNMTIETIADMVWALDHDIRVEIFDPSTLPAGTNYQPICDDEPKKNEPIVHAASAVGSGPHARPIGSVFNSLKSTQAGRTSALESMKS